MFKVDAMYFRYSTLYFCAFGYGFYSLAFSINAYGKFHFTKFEFRATEKGIHYLWWTLFSA